MRKYEEGDTIEFTDMYDETHQCEIVIVLSAQYALKKEGDTLPRYALFNDPSIRLINKKGAPNPQ